MDAFKKNLALYWDRISHYPVCYRTYTLAKIGLSLAYLWFCLDYILITWARLGPGQALIPHPIDPSCFAHQWGGAALAHFLEWGTEPHVLLCILTLTPLSAGLFLSGRWRLVAGLWMDLTMILGHASAPLFESTVDYWLFWAFFLYAFCPENLPTLRNAFDGRAWRSNPLFKSRYAGAVTLLSFGVYFYAGWSKIVIAPQAWLGGTALQNLAYDTTMYDWIQGAPIPFWISLILCWVTLAQRLIVPFFFYIPTGPWRLLSWFILASMHLIYSLVMRITLFPFVGISTLFLVLPPALFHRAEARLEEMPHSNPPPFQKAIYGGLLVLVIFCPALQVLSHTQYALSKKPLLAYETYLFLPLHWEMYANVGPAAKERWKLKILDDAHQRIDLTDLPKPLLPHTWRTRFYLYEVTNEVYADQGVPGPLLTAYAAEAERLYLEQHPHRTILARYFLRYNADAAPSPEYPQ